MDGGPIVELRPGDIFSVAPGHDSWENYPVPGEKNGGNSAVQHLMRC